MSKLGQGHLESREAAVRILEMTRITDILSAASYSSLCLSRERNVGITCIVYLFFNLWICLVGASGVDRPGPSASRAV